MPEFLEPDRVALSLSDGVPTITLDGVEVSATDEWSVLNRTTLLVVDGPDARASCSVAWAATAPTSHPRAGTRRCRRAAR